MKRLAFIIISSMFTLCLFFSNSYAAGDDAPVPIQGGDLTAGNTLVLPITGLIPYAYYNVTCNLINDNYKAQYPTVINAITACRGSATCGAGNILINGKALDEGQALLNQEKNSYSLSDVIEGGPNTYPVMEFKNLDQSNDIQIQDCVATLMTSK